MTAEIRLIQPKDNLKIAQIIRDVLTEFKANKPGTAYFDESLNRLSTVFEKDKSAYWVIEENGEILGGGGIFPTEGLPDDTCELVKLYLHPSAREKGFAKAIMNNCFETAKAFGYHKVYLESMPELSNAVSLYERMGFEKLCNPLGNSGHFGCDIWMVKKLSD